MEGPSKELSLKFYSFLCHIIGTKEVVNIRRQTYAVKDDHTLRDEFIQILSSGSKAEGLDLKGSDVDIMIVSHDVQVFEQFNQVKHNDGKLTLIMDTKNSKPGFTKLLVHQPEIYSRYCSDYIDKRTGFSYYSSQLSRQIMFDKFSSGQPDYYIHGPCTTYEYPVAHSDFSTQYDYVNSLHCTDWISQAWSWIIRTKYSWASDEVIRNILRYGVLFVPIGSKTSTYTDLEWRISFSYAEKQLIFSFNHVQLLCYALLKIMLNDIIKKTFGDLLCSYFMKTIMFWLCEETDVSFWTAENTLSCFMTCFQRLIYCVENETCLHYFIPENNLFENRFGSEHKNLQSRLHALYNLGWTCLLQAETLQSFRRYVDPSLLSEIPISTFFLSLLYFRALNGKDYPASIKRCVYQIIRLEKEKELYMFLQTGCCQFFPQKSCEEDSVQGNNKVSYRLFRQRLSHLLIGVNHDAVSGWLLLASFYFTQKQYSVCKILIDHSLTKFTPERCNIHDEHNMLTLQHYIEIQNIIGLRSLKNYTIDIVRMCGNSGIIPDELRILNPKEVIIPSLIFAHVLNFLFYHRTGDERKKRYSFRDLVFATKHVSPSVNIEICLDIVHNLLSNI